MKVEAESIKWLRCNCNHKHTIVTQNTSLTTPNPSSWKWIVLTTLRRLDFILLANDVIIRKRSLYDLRHHPFHMRISLRDQIDARFDRDGGRVIRSTAIARICSYYLSGFEGGRLGQLEFGLIGRLRHGAFVSSSSLTLAISKNTIVCIVCEPAGGRSRESTYLIVVLYIIICVKFHILTSLSLALYERRECVGSCDILKY